MMSITEMMRICRKYGIPSALFRGVSRENLTEELICTIGGATFRADSAESTESTESTEYADCKNERKSSSALNLAKQRIKQKKVGKKIPIRVNKSVSVLDSDSDSDIFSDTDSEAEVETGLNRLARERGRAPRAQNYVDDWEAKYEARLQERKANREERKLTIAATVARDRAAKLVKHRQDYPEDVIDAVKSQLLTISNNSDVPNLKFMEHTDSRTMLREFYSHAGPAEFSASAATVSQVILNLTDLNDTDETIIQPATFVGTLFPHQKTLISAMTYMENTGVLISNASTIVDRYNRNINIDPDASTNASDGKHNSKNAVYQTNLGILAELLGSGKTIITIGLILYNKTLPLRRIININSHNSMNYNVTFPKQDNIINASLIFVGSAVLLQWIDALTQFAPSLRVYVIKDVRALRSILPAISLGVVPYDIILAKNKTVTVPILSTKLNPPVDFATKKSRYMINVIANASRGRIWKRVVIDDFDTTKYSTSEIPKSQFVWRVGATYDPKMKIPNTSGCPLYGPPCNNSLVYNSTVQCANDYVAKSIVMTDPVVLRYIHVRQHANVIGLISTLQGDSSNIMQLINADSFASAATEAGIESANPYDIFSHLLGKNMELYTKAAKMQEYIRGLDFAAIAELPMSADPLTHTQLVLMEPFTHNYSNLRTAIEQEESTCKSNQTRSKNIMTRVTEGIAEDECTICCEGLDDFVIMKCCGKTMCITCGMKHNKFVRADKDITGVCAMCRQEITFTTMINVNKSGIELSSLNIENIDTAIEQHVVSLSEEKLNEEMKERKNAEMSAITKIDTLIAILCGKTPAITPIPGEIPSAVLRGSATPIFATTPKVIVFTITDELISDIIIKVKPIMDELKTKAVVLGGSFANLHDQTSSFQNSTDITLFINGATLSSGLNLQSATDLVIMHKFNSHNRSKYNQILGRIQRIGRICTARIHLLEY